MKKKQLPNDDPIYTGDGVEVIGNYPSLIRTRTGLFSLDYALSLRGELGLPSRMIVELYGYTNTGKSTLSYFLSGKLAKAHGGDKIGICDVEMLDRNKYLPTAVAMGGFNGQVVLIDVVDKDGKPATHEKMLMNLCVKFVDEKMPVIVWDSVGATQSMVEVKGEFGEAFMGKKAKLVSQVVQAMRTVLITKDTPSTVIAINHIHSIMGAGRGHTTTGGERIKFLSGVRLMLWSEEVIRLKDDEVSKPIGFVVSGVAEKLRPGARGGEFGFYIVPGFGVHPGASAMFDAFRFGLAERDARVKLNGKSMGYLKADLLTYAAEGRNRKFEPFIEEIEKHAHKIERSEI